LSVLSRGHRAGAGFFAGDTFVNKQLEIHARYLAYRWLRVNQPGASHSQGWEYSLKNWANFLFEAKRHFNVDEEELGLLEDSAWIRLSAAAL
jgi:hypothetical protein